LQLKKFLESIMNAIEFQSTVKNGFIKIPSHYSQRQYSNARIIVLTDDYQSVQKKKVHFTDFGLAMPANYKFNRDEANARR